MLPATTFVQRVSGDSGLATYRMAFADLVLAAAAVVGHYTANPASLGAGKLLCSGHMGLSTVGGTAAALMPFNPDFGAYGEKPVILRPGSSDILAISWGGGTVFANQLLHGCVVWAEEPR